MPFFPKEEIEALLAPVVLTEASGDWTASRHAIDMVQRACSVDQEDAQRALARRAVVVVPVNCGSWSVGVGPYFDSDRIDFSPPTNRENQHFKSTINRQSFDEILHFFRALEDGIDRQGHWTIEHMNWATGDFKIDLERDFRTVSSL